jgi:hypothetical protein
MQPPLTVVRRALIEAGYVVRTDGYAEVEIDQNFQ